MSPGPTAPNSVAGRIVATLEMIKFSHSVFALPFALAALLLASEGWPGTWTFTWVVVAMVAARSAAMGFNRLVDVRFDVHNPRTQLRALPAGILSRRFVAGFVVVACVVFVVAAGLLNSLCAVLSPLALAVILGYSYAKRFTILCHLWLGVALGLTPLAAWVAVTGTMDGSLRVPAVLALAVTFWVAGFDLIYACQDVEFDRGAGLHSLPARIGTRRALRIAACVHALALVLLAAAAALARLGPWSWVGIAGVGVLLATEHVLARPARTDHLEVAFFHVNSLVGLAFLAGVVGDLVA